MNTLNQAIINNISKPTINKAKFYEFTDGYYALISALNVEDAKLGYIKEIEEDMDINELQPIEISPEEAKKKCLTVDIIDYPQTEEEKIKEFNEYFYLGDYSETKYKLVLIDSWLL